MARMKFKTDTCCDERDSEWLGSVFEVSFGTQRNTVTGLNVGVFAGGHLRMEHSIYLDT